MSEIRLSGVFDDDGESVDVDFVFEEIKVVM